MHNHDTTLHTVESKTAPDQHPAPPTVRHPHGDTPYVQTPGIREIVRVPDTLSQDDEKHRSQCGRQFQKQAEAWILAQCRIEEHQAPFATLQDVPHQDPNRRNPAGLKPFRSSNEMNERVTVMSYCAAHSFAWTVQVQQSTSRRDRMVNRHHAYVPFSKEQIVAALPAHIVPMRLLTQQEALWVLCDVSVGPVRQLSHLGLQDPLRADRNKTIAAACATEIYTSVIDTVHAKRQHDTGMKRKAEEDRKAAETKAAAANPTSLFNMAIEDLTRQTRIDISADAPVDASAKADSADSAKNVSFAGMMRAMPHGKRRPGDKGTPGNPSPKERQKCAGKGMQAEKPKHTATVQERRGNGKSDPKPNAKGSGLRTGLGNTSNDNSSNSKNYQSPGCTQGAKRTRCW